MSVRGSCSECDYHGELKFEDTSFSWEMGNARGVQKSGYFYCPKCEAEVTNIEVVEPDYPEPDYDEF